MSFSSLETTFLPLEIVFPKPQKVSVLPSTSTQLEALLSATQAACEKAAQETYQTSLAAMRLQAHEYIIRMLEQAVLARHRLFGASSEQLSAQVRLFDEAEALVSANPGAPDQAIIPPEPQASAAEDTLIQPAQPTQPVARGKRRPLPAELPRVDVIHDVPEADRTCDCGTPMVEIGQEVSEQLDIVPMQVRVIRHIRKRYACPTSQHAPVTAPLPAQPLPKSNASADFLAMLLTVKFVDGQPLARFEHVLSRHDVLVPRQTLARWVIGCSELLQPLHNLMRDELLDCSLLHMDETVVQVLKEKDKSPTSNSYMWVQTGGPPDKPVVLYDYDASRSATVPTQLLEGYKGYLMTDGYDGYNALERGGDVIRLACWAHVRRRFVEAVRVQPKGKRGLADEAVALIGKLYGVEREFKAASDEARLAARQGRSVAVLAELQAWLQKNQPRVTPKSALGTAMAYMGNLWGKLTRYTERGDLPIDNNRCENAIRPFVLGRKAWLFSDTPAGAHSSAVIYSLVETAKANGLEPYAWLRRVLRELPAATTVEAVVALLPWNVRIADLAAKTAQ